VNDLVEAGKLRPVIDRTHPLSGALACIEGGHSAGKVLVTVDH